MKRTFLGPPFSSPVKGVFQGKVVMSLRENSERGRVRKRQGKQVSTVHTVLWCELSQEKQSPAPVLARKYGHELFETSRLFESCLEPKIQLQCRPTFICLLDGFVRDRLYYELYTLTERR